MTFKQKAFVLFIVKIEGFVQLEVSDLLIRNMLIEHLDSKIGERSRGLAKTVIIINVYSHPAPSSIPIIIITIIPS